MKQTRAAEPVLDTLSISSTAPMSGRDHHAADPGMNDSARDRGDVEGIVREIGAMSRHLRRPPDYKLTGLPPPSRTDEAARPRHRAGRGITSNTGNVHDATAQDPLHGMRRGGDRARLVRDPELPGEPDGIASRRHSDRGRFERLRPFGRPDSRPAMASTARPGGQLPCPVKRERFARRATNYPPGRYSSRAPAPGGAGMFYAHPTKAMHSPRLRSRAAAALSSPAPSSQAHAARPAGVQPGASTKASPVTAATGSPCAFTTREATTTVRHLRFGSAGKYASRHGAPAENLVFKGTPTSGKS